jgi:hypothetical protein
VIEERSLFSVQSIYDRHTSTPPANIVIILKQGVYKQSPALPLLHPDRKYLILLAAIVFLGTNIKAINITTVSINRHVQDLLARV